MSDKVNLLCQKGFINIDKINKNFLYIIENNKLVMVEQNMKRYNYNFLIKLATGTNLRLHNQSILTGTIFENIIKNDLSVSTVDNFKIDDYLYTPFKHIEQSYLKTNIELASVQNKTIGYISIDLVDFCKTHKLSLSELDKNMKSYYDKNNSLEGFLIDNNALSTIDKNLKINEDLINFLSITLIKGKLSSKSFPIRDGLSYTSKKISYRFKNDIESHQLMSSAIIEFLNKLKIPFNTVRYKGYYYLNIFNEPLYIYFNNLKLNSLREITTFTKEFQTLFLNKLFYYSNNKYYTDPDTYHTLKELCYNNKMILSFNKRSDNDKTVQPISCSLMDINQSDNEVYPDILYLGHGYLTRIIDIQKCSEKQRTIKDYLIIG